MRLSLDHRARSLLRRLPQQNGYRLAEAVLLCALAAQCARLIYIAVTPIGPVGEWRPDSRAAAIAAEAPELFRSFDPFFRVAPDAGGVVTSLQLTLFGTRLDEVSGQGSAIIAGPDGQQNSYGVGDEILPGVTLKAVAFDSVTIDRGGAAEQIFLDQSNGAGTGEAGEGAAPPTAADMAPGGGITADQIKAGLQFLPRREGGRISGLVVRAAGDGSAYQAAGFREGDIIVEINGKPVSNVADVQRVFATAAPGFNISVSVERGGNVLPISISIAS
ncbi:type II secretion system protein N [Sphingomonas sp. C3-2]|uniref:type II secretion system protein N n=1 Tax=Sphingomonas sp. C3-2 TaxID=3062169 RepID=UPI00294B9968|nr:type II secretion system protein N [Sphingomonas sp. C3-2]WOK36833.1 type II secretion system protein N [Sphingomonas sp. C3-2]